MADRVKEKGIECPDCGCPDTSVWKTRHFKLHQGDREIFVTRRQRLCKNCGTLFRTTERAVGT